MITPYEHTNDITPQNTTKREYDNTILNLLENKKFVRTTITNQDGTITSARINIETGEIKPYTYNDNTPDIEIIPKENAGQDAPFWMSYLGKEEYEPTKDKPTISRKNKTNNNNVFLKEFDTLSEALEAIPQLDNMITGVSRLSCGNNKPINQKLLFAMLRDLDDINQDTVQEYTGYSTNYSRRLAQYMRVLVNAFDNHVEYS